MPPPDGALMQRPGRLYNPPLPPEFKTTAEEDRLARETVNNDVAQETMEGLASLARYGMRANLDTHALDFGGGQRRSVVSLRRESEQLEESPSSRRASCSSTLTAMGSSPTRQRWMRSANKAEGTAAARRLREAARLKALQRTPYPMVLARLKLLLDRLSLLKEDEANQAGLSPDGLRCDGRVYRTSAGRISPEPGDDEFNGTRRQLSKAATNKVKAIAAMDPEPQPNNQPGLGELPPIERVREELAITFAYVSDFLRKVPEETRVASIDYARMEAYKKDQTVYMQGDVPSKFYIILTGAVEVWAHPAHEPRKKTVLAQLKRGQSFGEKDILNGELRTECVTPTRLHAKLHSIANLFVDDPTAVDNNYFPRVQNVRPHLKGNCTFLVLDAGPFTSVFSEHFEQLLARAQDFFTHHVDMFKKVPAADGFAVIRHMLLSSYPPGKEWEPAVEPQIYFIKSGSATLESHDKRGQAVVITRSMLGLNEGTKDDDVDFPPVSDAGVLCNVVMRDGRAVGTLGHEEEIRRLKRQLIPKRVIATLDIGSHFGGGVAALGAGDLQNSLRTLATTTLEAYHCHIEVFLKHASPALLSALRDDIAFKLTYLHGRAGMLGPEPVIGHTDSLLVSCLTKPKSEASGLHSARGDGREESSNNQAGGGNGAAGSPPFNGIKMNVKRRRAQKHVHEPGRYNPEVEKALQYISSLQAHGNVIQAGAQDSMARAKLVGKAAAEGILPIPGYTEFLLAQGVTPSERFWSMPALCATNARTAAISPLLKQVYPEGLRPLADKLDQLMLRTQCAASQTGLHLQGAIFSDSSPRCYREQGGATADQPKVRPATSPALPRAGAAGALISAGLVWDRDKEISRTPGLRQCLTYEEIAMVKADARKPAS